MQLSEVISIATDVANALSVIIFGFAALRAFTIGRALLNRVYKSRAYLTGLLALVEFAGILSGEADQVYLLVLIILYVIVDTTILAALELDFFHRNTLRWKQVRIAAYILFVADAIYGGYFVNYVSKSPSIAPSAALHSLLGVIFVVAASSLLFIFAYTATTAVVSVRRTPDRPLRRFMTLSGLFLFGILVNSLVFVFISEVFAPFLWVAFAYITYCMAMSLSPLGKVEKEIRSSTTSGGQA